MFTRQVRHRRGLSKDQIPSRLSLGSCFLLAGTGRPDGGGEGKKNTPVLPVPRCHRNTIGPAVPPAIAGSASPLAGRRYAGVSSWGLASISTYRRLLPGREGGGGGEVFLGLLIHTG